MRVIDMPATGRRVSLGEYVRAIKLAKANPDRIFKYGLTCWWPCKGAEIVRQFMLAISVPQLKEELAKARAFVRKIQVNVHSL